MLINVAFSKRVKRSRMSTDLAIKKIKRNENKRQVRTILLIRDKNNKSISVINESFNYKYMNILTSRSAEYFHFPSLSGAYVKKTFPFRNKWRHFLTTKINKDAFLSCAWSWEWMFFAVYLFLYKLPPIPLITAVIQNHVMYIKF